MDRLATKYNQSGFLYLVLVSYLLAPAEEFASIKEAYHKLLRSTELEVCGGKPKECEYETLTSCPNLISISRADYRGCMGDVSVFHFLVHIPEYKGKQEEETNTKKKKASLVK